MTTREAADHAFATLPSCRGDRSYRLLRRLSQSAWAEVYEAEDDAGNALCVKIRASRARGIEADRRLLREAAALASIRHSNVVRVVDVGIASDGRPFFAMPLLVGPSLREVLRESTRLTPTRAARLVADVLDGLSAAHRAGVVHRDVKPDNVIVTRGSSGRERAIVLDLGIAEVDDASDESTSFDVIGTPTYLAPEQILGRSVDARTDVYAAATMLFEAIAGRPPFNAAGPFERMRAHLYEEPERLRDHALVPIALDRAVRRALSKNPAARFPTAHAFATALRRAFEASAMPASVAPMLRAS